MTIKLIDFYVDINQIIKIEFIFDCTGRVTKGKTKFWAKKKKKKKCLDLGSNLGPPAWQHEMLGNDLFFT